eukprot:7973256-Pyramimonas_sp.AAC.1
MRVDCNPVVSKCPSFEPLVFDAVQLAMGARRAREARWEVGKGPGRDTPHAHAVEPAPCAPSNGR